MGPPWPNGAPPTRRRRVRPSRSHTAELGRLSGRSLVDTDSRLREIDADLRHAIDDDVSNVGSLRRRYEEDCRSIVADGQARVEHWHSELGD